MDDFNDTIIDATKPNAGRIYDYFLGGSNHFEVDRQMAEELIKKAPFAKKFAVITRWFLRLGIKRALEQGFTQFLDYASGLPSWDHIHNVAPVGTKVMYSDIDPVTVKLGNKMIGENPIVKYRMCNAAEPEKLLETVEFKALFRDNHKAAIGYNGIFWFLDNKQISHAMKILYDWADKGSMVYFTDYDNSENRTAEAEELSEMYRGMNMFGEARSRKEITELVKPWKIEEPGLLLIEEWGKLRVSVSDEANDLFGGGGLYGGFLKK